MFVKNQYVLVHANRNSVFGMVDAGFDNKLARVEAVYQMVPYVTVRFADGTTNFLPNEWVRPIAVYLTEQESQVFLWLLKGGGISTREALNYLGVGSLTKVVSRLREIGMPIKAAKSHVAGLNRKVHVYFIPQEEMEWVVKMYLPIPC